MSKVRQCDLCFKVEPEVNVRYSRRHRWNWFKFNWDSQGGSFELMDLCEQCWEKLGLTSDD